MLAAARLRTTASRWTLTTHTSRQPYHRTAGSTVGFSTQPTLKTVKPDKSTTSNLHQSKNPGELPKFSMKDLQASPTVKVVVYTFIGILATVETYTYSLWAYHRWFKPEEEVDS